MDSQKVWHGSDRSMLGIGGKVIVVCGDLEVRSYELFDRRRALEKLILSETSIRSNGVAFGRIC